MKIHFKGLNALRFYAALSVVVHHIMFNPHEWFGLPKLPDTIGRFFIGGTDAVYLFFVLSGFLITYLMLVERERSGTVSVKKFYLRRILRIWPLYFAIIAVAFLLPQIIQNYSNPLSSPLVAVLLILFQGNIAFILRNYYPLLPLEHLWSIAIEEQFYLFIPHIGKSRVNLVKVFIVVIVFWWALMAILSIVAPDNFFTIVLLNLRYDVIATGGLCACAYYYKHWMLKWLYHPVVSGIAVLIVVLIVVFIPETLGIPYTVVISLAFAIVILNVATNEKFFLKLDHPWLEVAGNWSYGIYMIHTTVQLLFLTYIRTHMNDFIYQVGVYPIIITATIVLAWLSYRYFETPFLRLKNTFKVTR